MAESRARGIARGLMQTRRDITEEKQLDAMEAIVMSYSCFLRALQLQERDTRRETAREAYDWLMEAMGDPGMDQIRMEALFRERFGLEE